jgi:hypothetical protein
MKSARRVRVVWREIRAEVGHEPDEAIWVTIVYIIA